MFRFSKIPRSYGRHCETVHVQDVVQSIMSDKSGVQHVRFVNRDNDDVTKSIPKPSDYTLENLLLSGVPLHQVSASILDDNPPTSEQIEKFVSTLDDNTNN